MATAQSKGSAGRLAHDGLPRLSRERHGRKHIVKLGQWPAARQMMSSYDWC